MKRDLLRQEWPVVGAALGLLALHTVFDTLIAPERGTGWSDHLAAALVPLSLLAVVAVAYRRLRAGARAAVAAYLGALTLLGAGLAIMDAGRTFERGSDWTGFLLAPAGRASLAIAAALLWRSRRGGRLRLVRRAALALGAAVAV